MYVYMYILSIQIEQRVNTNIYNIGIYINVYENEYRNSYSNSKFYTWEIVKVHRLIQHINLLLTAVRVCYNGSLSQQKFSKYFLENFSRCVHTMCICTRENICLLHIQYIQIYTTRITFKRFVVMYYHGMCVCVWRCCVRAGNGPHIK